MSDLKPCPFCGGEASVVESSNGMMNVMHSVGCDSPCRMSPSLMAFSREEAVIEWNNRPHENKIKERYDEIACRLKNIKGWVSEVSKRHSISGQDEWYLPIYRIIAKDDDGVLELTFLTSELREKGIEKIKEEGFDIVETDYLFLDLPLEHYSDDPIGKIKAEAVREAFLDGAACFGVMQSVAIEAYETSDTKIKLEKGEL